MLSSKPKYAKQYFFTGEYLPIATGELRTKRPNLCPNSHSGIPGKCDIIIKEYRPRKFGPGHHLTVYNCKNHRRSFTVYPEGWLPYGRRPLVGEQSSLEAVNDRKSGSIWPEYANNERPTRYTQSHWIRGWLKILGIDSSLDKIQRHQAAVTLNTSFLTISETAHRVRDGPEVRRGYKLKTMSRLISETLSLTGANLQMIYSRGLDLGYWGMAVNA